ncbi:MAG: hypothetical protein R3F55_17895 [Alphaproteobacteria bacterium]
MASALAVAAALPAQAIEPVFTFADLNTLTGLDGDWYGYRSADRFIISNAVSDTAIYYIAFNDLDAQLSLTVDAELIASDPTSAVGLFCCRQEEAGPYLVVMLEPGGNIGVWKIDTRTGDASSVMSVGGATADPSRAEITMIETADGMDILIDGTSVGSYGDGDLRAGKSGLFFWGTGVMAVNDFNLYEGDLQASSNGGSGFWKGLRQESAQDTVAPAN